VLDVDDLQLEKLSVSELRELKDNVDNAIRAVIRARAQLKAQQAMPAQVKAPAKVDLERERDAWMAAKRQPKPF
jgi:hypothetical protein